MRPCWGGGGSLILARDSLVITPLLTDGPWEGLFDVVGIRGSSTIGPLNILAVYSPPNARVALDIWSPLIDSVGGGTLFCCVATSTLIPLCGALVSPTIRAASSALLSLIEASFL